MIKVLFTASECVPFIKTGGLADVLGALPRKLNTYEQVEARVIMPKYSQIDDRFKSGMKHIGYFYINFGWRMEYCGVEKAVVGDVTYYFIDNEYFFARNYIYSGGEDECDRFSFFCKAVLAAIPHLDFLPDIIHCNDWQTGMIPFLLQHEFAHDPKMAKIKTVFTIQNLRYQGNFSISHVQDFLGLEDQYFTPDKLEFYGGASFMKAGIIFSDVITTVSKSYAQEIKNSSYGERMEGLLQMRSDSLYGILNGIDYDIYNPRYDELLEHNYSTRSLLGKQKSKAALQKELYLEESPDTPILSMVTRLNEQKGIDLVSWVIEDIMNMHLQMIVLGCGDEKYEELFKWAQWKYGKRFAFRHEMNEALAHRIYAGSDMILMPSLFEPCGLTQMIAMHYGTLPVARETGGLIDTVIPYNKFTGDGTGFTFSCYNAHEMLYTIERAVDVYHGDKPAWLALQKQAMKKDFSWKRSAKEYIKLYSKLCATEY